MATAIFPSYAKILISGFTQQRESALLRTEMESGAPKQVKVRSRVMITRTCKIFLSSLVDYQSFDEWFGNTLEEGALWFNYDDPISGTTKEARFVGGGYVAAPLMDKTSDWVITLKIESWG